VVTQPSIAPGTASDTFELPGLFRTGSCAMHHRQELHYLMQLCEVLRCKEFRQMYKAVRLESRGNAGKKKAGTKYPHFVPASVY